MSLDISHYDAVALATLIREKKLSVNEVRAAAIARLREVDVTLHAVVAGTVNPKVIPDITVNQHSVLAGVPIVIKDNTALAGLPVRHGSLAISAAVAKQHDPVVQQFLSIGLQPIAKTRMPEFGLTATTEFSHNMPARNPWSLEHSTGGSSGGSAALVAAGVLPIAHANDGGGSTRIPASCCGLVGLKPSRNRLPVSPINKGMPINLVSEGVLTRSVRDTAAFYAEAEKFYQHKALPKMGLVEAGELPPLRIAMVTALPNGERAHHDCVDATEQTAAVLQHLGHHVEAVESLADQQMADDFLLYWAALAGSIKTFGKLLFDRQFDVQQLELLTVQLAQHCRKNLWRLPGALRRLQQYADVYARYFDDYDVILSPTLAQPPTKLGQLQSEDYSFIETIDALTRYVAFTPAQNVSGAPAISLPMAYSARSAGNLPIGVQLAGAVGQEALLLQLAYQLEATNPWPLIAPVY